MSVNIFKNGILSKIAGAVGDAVPLINNFLTNQEGKGAADANTVYVLNNKIDELNSSLTANNNKFYFDYQDGKYGFNTDPNRGADTFSPFSSGVNEIAFGWHGDNFGGGIIKKDGTTLGGTVHAKTLYGDYVSMNIGKQYREDNKYKGSITFTALVAGDYKIYEKGTVTDKSVSANEVIYTKTMSGGNTPVSVVAM